MTRDSARDVWVFDLDNTLYPAESSIYDAIGERMIAYIARALAVTAEEALRLREAYFHEYGATVFGLVAHHNVDPVDFLTDVHLVSLDDARCDSALLALIGALPGRRFVFTNGGADYAQRILERLGLLDLFERVVALEDVGLAPKPQLRAFSRMIDLCRFDPHRAVMFEDHARNLETAHALGFVTVLVGAGARAGGHVDFAGPDLASFLRTHEPAQIDRPPPSP